MQYLFLCVKHFQLKVSPGINLACLLQDLALTIFEAGAVEFSHVKLHPDDGEHEDGEEKQQADLKQRNHGFHYGLQHHLET